MHMEHLECFEVIGNGNTLKVSGDKYAEREGITILKFPLEFYTLFTSVGGEK